MNETSKSPDLKEKNLATRSLTWVWKTGFLSTFLAGLFALLPIVITVGIMAWAGGILKDWLGPESIVGSTLSQFGFRFVANPMVAAVFGWGAVLIAVWILGILLKSVGKKRLEKIFHATMERIPFVRTLYGPVAQVVDMLQREPTDKLQSMNVVYCAFGNNGSPGFLALLASDQIYQFGGEPCQLVYVPTSPLPMSGLIVFVATDSVYQIDMQVDALMKIYFSIGVISPKVIPDKYVVKRSEIEIDQQ